MAEDRSEEQEEFPEWPETARRSDDREEESRVKERTSGDLGGRKSGESVEKQESWEQVKKQGSEEDTAQANARSEIVSEDELPAHTSDRGSAPRFERDVERRVEHGQSEEDQETPPEHGRVVSEPTDERPSLEELREELNEQFESIKIVRPGQYELNLMELYDRDEYIISLQEDGRYVIDVPDSWRNADE